MYKRLTLVTAILCMINVVLDIAAQNWSGVLGWTVGAISNFMLYDVEKKS